MKHIPLLLLLLSACSSPQPTDPGGAPLELPPGQVAGFDAPLAAPMWHVGDHALFRVTVTDGDQRTERWLRIEVVGPVQPEGGYAMGQMRSYRFSVSGESRVMDVPLLDVAIDVYDPTGLLLGADRTQVPETFLTQGFAPLARSTVAGWSQPGVEGPGAESEAEQEKVIEHVMSYLALTTYLELIQASKPLSSIFWRVVDRPSLWSMLTGVKLSIAEPEEPARATPVQLPAPVGELDGWSLPLALDMNGKRAVNIELKVVEALPPLLITGGVVELIARHPKHPRRVEIELVSSRRGGGMGFRREFSRAAPAGR
jgi:hypothetical protein